MLPCTSYTGAKFNAARTNCVCANGYEETETRLDSAWWTPTCSQCAAGKFALQNDAGTVTCASCASEYEYSDAGASACTLCSTIDGAVAGTTRASCACGPNFTPSGSGGSLTCVCKAGRGYAAKGIVTYNNGVLTTGNTDVSTCGAPCLAGFRSSSANRPCTACPAGTYSLAGSTSCLSCASITGASTTAASGASCTCLGSFVSSGTGAARQCACDENMGFVPAAPAQGLLARCVACPDGYSKPLGNTACTLSGAR